MPAKKVNGNGHCKIHSHAATACRVCLVQGLQEFRLTNLRAGLRIAADRITALRSDYAAKGSAEVKADGVSVRRGCFSAVRSLVFALQHWLFFGNYCLNWS